MPSSATWWLVVYSTTGALQPLLVDDLRHRGLAPKRLLGPMLANCVGMALVAPAREAFAPRGGGSWAGAARGAWRTVAVAVVLDFGSATLLCLALLSCGAAAFTLVYSSCALIVACLGTCAGARLRAEQWVAVVLATAGIVSYELAGSDGSAGSRGGLALALLGSLGHGAMFVYAEHALKACAKDGLTPFRLSSLMGAAEAAALAAYVALVVARSGAPVDPRAALAYAPLVLVDCAHALSFFATLGDRGAVSASMLKGVQVLVVFSASAVLSCDPPARVAGCASPAKAGAVAAVVAALALFHGRDPPKLHRADSPPAPPSPPASPRRGTLRCDC